jgi:uncharacterized membrane protein
MTVTLFYSPVFLSALGSGLVAGVFFAFSTFVMAALARLPVPAGAAAMNAINVTVLTPAFMSVLFGTAVIALGAAVLALLNWSASGAAAALAGAVLYVAGVIFVTMFFNVPLNYQLAAVAPGSAAEAELWQRYLRVWVNWNHVRTAAPLASLALFILALRG